MDEKLVERLRKCIGFDLGEVPVIEEAATALTLAQARIRELETALDGVYTYCNDTLSGRADGGPDDRAWQREAVIRARDIARPFARPEMETYIRERNAHRARQALKEASDV